MRHRARGSASQTCASRRVDRRRLRRRHGLPRPFAATSGSNPSAVLPGAPRRHQPGLRVQHRRAVFQPLRTRARRRSRATRGATTTTGCFARRLRSARPVARRTAGPGLEAFSCVDDGPVQERVFAEQAGLGWIGKNTCLINPQLGSWLFLAEVLTNLDLERRCARRWINAGRARRVSKRARPARSSSPTSSMRHGACRISRSRRAVRSDPECAPCIGPHVYGCDICQDVCPWNRRAAVSDDPAWQPRPPLAVAASARPLRACPTTAWRALLRTSAMRRAGLRRIRRSLAYAARQPAAARIRRRARRARRPPVGGRCP